MNVQELCLATIKELATDGNPKAQFALTLAEQCQPAPRAAIVQKLKNASSLLSDALRENDIRWTMATDRRIKEAQAELLAVMALV